MYEPCDDSYLLAENLGVKEGERVLDVGTGSGLQGLVASAKAELVVSSDISAEALKCASYNARQNGVRNIHFVESDLFCSIQGKFHLIAFNPPYLPTEPLEEGDEHSLAWNGGMDGLRITRRFVKAAKGHLTGGGRVLMVASSLSGIEEVLQLFAEAGLKPRIKARKHFFFEELAIVEAHS